MLLTSCEFVGGVCKGVHAISWGIQDKSYWEYASV
jgi:hypothetical protein